MSATAPPDDIEALKVILATLSPFKKDEQSRLLRWVHEKLDIVASPHTTPPHTTPPHLAAAHGPNPTQIATDIKSFMVAKAPKSDNQFAAAVAYYYMFEAPEAQRKEAINATDLLDACRKTQRTRPGSPGQTLINAVSQGLLDKADRGHYRINSVGENLVAMVLPSTDGGTIKRSKKSKKAAPKKKGKR